MADDTFPPAVRAILALGGATRAARAFGDDVTPERVEAWMRNMSIPVGYLRRAAKLSKIPLADFLRYEESKVRQGGRRGRA
jgi:hypothetical protein